MIRLGLALLLLIPLVTDARRKTLNAIPRIVGGQNARESQFPYQVSLSLDGEHICGGSIISTTYILSAEHCVTGWRDRNLHRLEIRIGSVRHDAGGQMFTVGAVRAHPFKDAALLRLGRALVFTKRIGAIKLAQRSPPSGAAVEAIGWGYTNRRQDSLSTQLQFTTLRVLEQATCARLLGDLALDVFCAAHPPGKGICAGDSGGPAVYKGRLVGVASFTVGSCGTIMPDGFVKVASIYNWIKHFVAV